MPRLDAIYRYPVKGLSAEALPRVVLSPGETLPFDRAYTIENGPSGFDPAAPKHLPKIAFLMLMRNERLAELRTQFEDSDSTLTIRKDGVLVAEGRLDTEEGRQTIEAFFDRFAASDLRGPARVLRAPGHTFTDARDRFVSLINLATVRAIADEIGAPVHPLRFRGNFYVAGLPAWDEFGWVEKRLSAGGATFDVVRRIDRCDATNVDPDTGARDLTIPRSLLQAYGHADCGVYLRVISGGATAVGDEIAIA